MVNPESLLGSLSLYNFPTIVDMFALKYYQILLNTNLISIDRLFWNFVNALFPYGIEQKNDYSRTLNYQSR